LLSQLLELVVAAGELLLLLLVQEVVEEAHEFLRDMPRVSSLMLIDLVFYLATILCAVSLLPTIPRYSE
jgi:hypothetical protein